MRAYLVWGLLCVSAFGWMQYTGFTFFGSSAVHSTRGSGVFVGGGGSRIYHK